MIDFHRYLLHGLTSMLTDQVNKNELDEYYAKAFTHVLTKEYKEDAEEFKKVNDIEIKTCSFQKSLCNICADICRVTLAESPDSSCVKYYKPEYWQKVLEG